MHGIEGAAITDHDSLRGGLISKKYSDDNFLFIAGQEIATSHGDVIGLMIQEEISSTFFFEVIDQIKDQGGIAYLPHPSRKMTLRYSEIKNNIDVIEAVNGRSSRGENIWSSRLAKTLNIPYASGSDAHTIREIGKTKTTFSKDFHSEAGLRKILIDKSISRRINGVGKYEILNHFQSSLIGTMKTGKIKDLVKGAIKKVYR